MSEWEDHLRDALAISSSLYGMLATTFSGEPSRKTVTRLREDLGDLGHMKDAWDEPDLWRKAVALAKAGKSLLVREAARDYAGLFAGGRKGSVCPSESSYLEGVLYGASTLTVMEAYKQAGFEKEPTFREPDDHVSVEFVFRFLSGLDLSERMGQQERESEGLVAELTAERDFVRDHLVSWVPLLAKQVEGSAETPFYAAAASLADALVKADLRLHERILHSEG